MAMPFLLHPSISSDMVWELDWPLRNSFAPKNAREPSTMQFTVARQLKLHVPLLYFDFMVFTILSNLSYLHTRCLSMATSTGFLNIPRLLIWRTVRSVTFWHRLSM